MRYAATVLALLVLVAGGAGSSLATAPSGVGGGPTELGTNELLQTQQADENDSVRTTIVIDVHTDTNATWEIQTRYSFNSPEDVEAFDGFVDSLQRGEANTTLDEATFQNYVNLAAESTEREMALRNVRYTGAVSDDETTGTLTMSFTWTNFAEETSNGLRVGDAFDAPDGGTWFPWLTADQRLVVETPENYQVEESFQASTRGNTLVTDGPRDFRENPIYVTYSAPEVVNPPDGFEFTPELLAGVGAMLLLVVAGVLYLRRREKPVPRSPTDSEDGTAMGVAAASDTESEAETGGVDLSLLSDEERVEYLLEQRGGRMRQADIVKETGWSDAKVSQLLSAMAESGRVDKLRIGRENLISLPGEGHKSTDDE